MAELKGERRVIAMPQRSSFRRVRWGALAAAAALLFAALYLGRDAIDAMMAPAVRGPRSFPPTAACTACSGSSRGW